MDILNYNKTQTTQFIIPLLFKDKQITEIITNFDSLVNGYIADFDKPNLDNKIILVFNSKQKQLPEENQIEHYTKTVKDGEKTNDLFFYVYDLPEKYQEDYTFFLVGKYSKFSTEAKSQILNFWEAGENTLLYGVLYRTGTAIKKFWKDNFDTKIDDIWTKDDREWWIEPILRKEIYGTE
jgi:acyl-CoA synthetase (AMP-forming)/AMP-acid ligase II